MIDGARIQIFNPEVLTYRRKMLEKLAKTQVFRRWPEWLKAKVDRLIKEGLSPREISTKLVEEDNVWVKMRTVKKKIGRS